MRLKNSMAVPPKRSGCFCELSEDDTPRGAWRQGGLPCLIGLLASGDLHSATFREKMLPRTVPLVTDQTLGIAKSVAGAALLSLLI